MEEPRRSNGGHRLYPEETVTVLRMIKAAQRLGFTLEEVAEAMAQPRLRSRTVAKLAEVERKIADLHAIRETLVQAVDAGCDDLMACTAAPRCPLPF
ncbi:MerR family DNA-binding protein [Nonomuraea sp. NPDC059194]|uniref:MerR family DNA-binding protein n=1 Tax=Nonomuraea sp. NPDC059194 TaxID=3346764 RepID=UPI0036B9C8E5